MIKLFVTGDNHLCRQYSGSPIRNTLVQSRLDSLHEMVKTAELEECSFFVITGDLFDRVSNVSKKEIAQIIDILSTFNQTVLILPGNHDFFTGNEKLWKDFSELASVTSNIVLLNEYKPYSFTSGEEEIVVYPALCDSKHSKSNRLSWIKENCHISEEFSIGIAHGTIRGISPDLKEEYFPMDISELSSIPVDAWLIGHTHITYPFDLPYDKDVSGLNIFNAGTHEQLDSSNNTEGNALIVTLKRKSGVKNISVRKIRTGTIAYKNLICNVELGDTRSLQNILADLVFSVPDRTVVSLEISGTINEADYTHRENCYEETLGRFLSYTVNDEDLAPEITEEKIKDEFSELSLAAQFLEGLLGDPIEVQLAYDLIKTCNGTVS